MKKRLKPGRPAGRVTDVLMLRPYVKVNKATHPEIYEILLFHRNNGTVNDFVMEAILGNRPAPTVNRVVLAQNIAAPASIDLVENVNHELKEISLDNTSRNDRKQPGLTGFLQKAKKDSQ